MINKKSEIKMLMLEAIIELCEEAGKLQNSKNSSFCRLPIREQILLLAREMKVEIDSKSKIQKGKCIICLEKGNLDEFNVCQNCLSDFKQCNKKSILQKS